MTPLESTSTAIALPAVLKDAAGHLPLVFQYGGWALFLWLLWYVYAHDEQLDRWLARFEKLFLWLGSKKDKRYIRRDIQARINSASKKMNREAEGLVTKKIEVRWVNQENIESFLRKGSVVILMKHHQNQDKNVVNAAIHYALTGVLHTGKRYLSPEIQKALNLAITKKILCEEAESGTSVEYFSTSVLNPELGDANVKDAFSTLEKMEEKGLFTRILLREIRSLGKRLYPRQPEEVVLRETSGFFEFLKPFAYHERGNDISEWEFINGNIRVGVMYVAKRERLDNEGLAPYIRGIERKIGRGCEKIYLFGRRKENVDAVKMLVRGVQSIKPDLKARFEYYSQIFQGRKQPCVCVLLVTN